MIVVDTSALMEILMNQPQADACEEALAVSRRSLICAGTLAEALVVAQAKDLRHELEQLIGGARVESLPFLPDAARAHADAYRRYGRGYHPARLNLGDCFAYALAMRLGFPLLFVGDDFSRTDVLTVLPPGAV